jgi:hypothetical protein
LYIVNFAVRLLVLAFVFIGGAITFAGPQSNIANSPPVVGSDSGDLLRRTSQELPATEQSPDNSHATRDVG